LALQDRTCVVVVLREARSVVLWTYDAWVEIRIVCVASLHRARVVKRRAATYNVKILARLTRLYNRSDVLCLRRIFFADCDLLLGKVKLC
jgi:hypothetical protein